MTIATCKKFTQLWPNSIGTKSRYIYIFYLLDRWDSELYYTCHCTDFDYDWMQRVAEKST